MLTTRSVKALCITLGLAAVGSGCITTQASYEEELRAQQQYQLMQEQYQRLQGTVEGMQLEVERLRTELDRYRAESSRGAASQSDALRAQVDDLERRLRALDQARERDRQAIIDSLSGKISQVMASSKPKSTPVAKKPISNEGYEHVVESGQSLSAIASAYGVSAQAIIQANGLDNPNQLRVGQKLFIPAP